MKILKWILCILTLLSTILMLFVLPDTVPVHFNINGEPDRLGSKYELLLMPIVLIVCALSIDPLTKSYRKKSENTDNEKEKAELLSNTKVLNITGTITMLLFFVMNIFILYNVYCHTIADSNFPKFDIMSGVGVIMGITIALLGNFMPKTRKNSNIGFRLPWTMYNDTTWMKSNRFASYVLMIAGAIMAIFSLVPEWGMIIGMIAFFIALTISIVYAFFVYRQERSKENERNNKE